MDDRGEKIVNLARVMLHSDAVNTNLEPGHRFTPEATIKALCFTAMLAAIGGGAVTSWINEAHRPINHYEKVELDALFFYAARQRAESERHLRHDLQAQLDLSNLDNLSLQDFNRARDCLRQIIR